MEADLMLDTIKELLLVFRCDKDAISFQEPDF
jgi:hypothetical protein